MSEPLWRFEEISAALGITPASTTGEEVSGVSIDSRTLRPGDLFVAIRGERSDGHEFVDAAFARGATAAVVDHDFDSSSMSPLFHVPDTLQALNDLARASRARSSAKIIGVTGSVGKTGTKEMLRSMLSVSGPTHASEKSYNNLWGVPLSLARMPQSSHFGIFEIGMNHAGEISPLTKLVRPHIAIVTWVAPVHMEFFDSVEDIALAKAEIFEGLEPEGIAILPVDNAHFETLAGRAHQKQARVISFGEGSGSDSRLLPVERLDAGSRVEADILGSKLTFTLGSPGRHLAANAIAGLTAVAACGGNVRAAAQALARFESPEGRGRRAEFATSKGAVLLIDETYNANPASMLAALETLGEVPRSKYGRRVAVVGDMLELGHSGPQFHAKLATVIDSSAIDLVFCAGPLMAHLYDRLPVGKRGGRSDKAADLLPTLLEAVRGGDALMVKGSLGSLMGPLAEALRGHFASLADRAHGQDAA